MSDRERDQQIQEFLEVREPGANLEEREKDELAFALKVDLVNYRKFPRVDDNVTYKKSAKDFRDEIELDSSLELPDYSGPFRFDLRFSDFSKDAVRNMIEMSNEYYVLCVESWASEVASRFGDDVMREIQSAAWNDIVLPHVPRIIEEWMAFDVTDLPEVGADVVTFSPFEPDSRYSKCGKERLIKMLLGSHEFFLQVIEAWAAQVVVRYGLDEMFAIQWALWSEKVLPETRKIKIKWMNVTGGETHPVAAFMKDIQIDATSMPGKAFELTFEMPEPEVGIMTFNRCCAVDQWEALGRPDILEKNCHSTCPASLIETAKIYDPNMKIDILAIPPRKAKDDICCRWKLSMRTKDDPEYVAVEDTGGGSSGS